MGIETIINELVDVADKLDNNKKYSISDSICKVARRVQNLKFAQYVGVQGYWIRNERCWTNCYRIKRTENPEKSAQVVWKECQNEYVDSINNDHSGWEKYAGSTLPKLKKFASSMMRKKAERVLKAENSTFRREVNEKVYNRVPVGVAVFDTIQNNLHKYAKGLIDSSSEILSLSQVLDKEGYKKEASRLAVVSQEVLKEAQFSPTSRKGKAWDWFKNLFRGQFRGLLSKLKKIVDQADQVGATGNDLLFRKFVSDVSREMNELAQFVAKSEDSKVKNFAPMINNTLQNFLTQANQGDKEGAVFQLKTNINNILMSSGVSDQSSEVGGMENPYYTQRATEEVAPQVSEEQHPALQEQSQRQQAELFSAEQRRLQEQESAETRADFGGPVQERSRIPGQEQSQQQAALFNAEQRRRQEQDDAEAGADFGDPIQERSRIPASSVRSVVGRLRSGGNRHVSLPVAQAILEGLGISVVEDAT